MLDTVTLLIKQGPLKGRRYTFIQKTECVFGRGSDCYPRFPDDEANQTVSRYHCRVEVDPPRVRVRDLGSLNGTFVNGRLIGRRAEEEAPEQATEKKFPELELKEGDELRVGENLFSVHLAVPANCTECGKELTREQAEATRLADDSPLLCADCLRKADQTTVYPGSEDLHQAGVCASCGRGLSRRTARISEGGFLCSTCQGDPASIVAGLLSQAESEEHGLVSLRGLSVVSSLGRGSMGAAFLVRRKETDQQMALKILLPEVAVNEMARRAFLREVENSRVLNHPHVVRLFDSGSYQGIFFFTMEFCNGGSLDKIISERGGKLPLDEAAFIILQALDGLDYIHHAEIPLVKLEGGKVGQGRGLVHRDLKPANIFLTIANGSRTAKIADVGVGKAFDTAGLSGHTRTGTVAGSPASMPRQQVINFKYARPDVDVWAMAATFYKAVTGSYPRDFPPGQDPVLVVLRTQAVPIRQRDPSLPSKLAEVIDL
ncbi:MAG: protein kinase, partial [Pseudomonadota bacterium]